MKRVTVVIPTYKPGEYLEDCVKSFARQTLDKNLFEVIIVLNGCRQPYEDYIAHLIDQYSDSLDVRMIHTDTAGVSNARNIGLEQSDADYVTFMDDDDWATDDYLALLLEKADNHSIVVTNMIDFSEVDGSQKKSWMAQAYDNNKKRKNVTIMSARSFFSSACGKLLPREVIGNCRFNTNFKLGEDSLFMATISKNIQEIKLAEQNAVYMRRVRAKSAGRSKPKFMSRLANVSRQVGAYVSTYLKSPFKYNFLFFLSRIVAVIIRFK